MLYPALNQLLNQSMQMFLLGSDYSKCSSSEQTACADKEIRPRIPIDSFIDCIKICNEDNNCNFIFYIPSAGSGQKVCLKYSSCNKLRETTHIGSIYSKKGNCPGRLCYV